MTNRDFIPVTIEIFGAIIMFFAAMIFTIITGNKKKSEKNLFIILLASGFSLLMAACWYLVEGNLSNLSFKLNILCNFFVFICNPIMLLSINRYAFNLIKENNKKANIFLNLLVNIIAITVFLIPISNFFYKWMYYFDIQNNYHRLFGWYIYTFLNSIAMIICIISLLIQRRIISNNKFLAISFFFIAQFIGILLQTYIIGIPFVQIGTAIGSLWVVACYLLEWIKKEKDEISEDKKKIWLIESTFSIMILFISTAIITFIVSLNTVSNENSEQNSTALAYMVNATLDSSFLEPINVSKTMAQSEIILDSLSIENIEDFQNSSNEDKMINFMKRIKDKYDYQTVFVASEKTKAYYTYNGFSRFIEDDTDSFDSWYSDFKNKAVEYELNIDADKNNDMKLTIFVNMKIRDNKGDFLGVCGVAMSLDSLMNILNSYQYNYNLDIFLTDDTGLIQINSDKEKILNEYLEILPSDNNLSDDITYTRDNNSAILTKYLPDYSWYLIIKDYNPDKLNIFRIILPSITIYAIGVIIMLLVSLILGMYERKRSKELRVTKLQSEMAKAASEAKGRFLANMSHEIRTPLNAILGMDTMILRESNEKTIKEYAMNIHNAGNVLLSLINDILDISKIESGKMEIIPVEYNLSTLLQDVINMITAKSEAKGLEIKLIVDPSLPSILTGDDIRIRQIIVNLMNNAIKYTEKGSVTLLVNGESTDDNIFLNISVKDTGIGIKEEDLAKLYDDYVRIEESRNKNIEGTGLGMSITIQLLELMNSKLNVSSIYGKGSEFSFVLEQKIVDPTAIGDIHYKLGQNADSYSYESLFTSSNANILIVDDNDINRMVFINLLKDTGLQIDEADSGINALDLIFKKAYDIIFLDHMMPDMDGIEVLTNIKSKQNPNSNTPIIVLTANAISGVKESYLSAGFNDYLSKPIIPEQLEKMIFSYLPSEKKLINNINTKKKNVIEPELPIIEGIDWNYAMLHFADNNSLLNTLKNYVSAMDSEAINLNQLYNNLLADPDNASNLDLFRIKIHSLKASSTLLGCIPLAGTALLLEKAARDGLTELIKDVTPYFLNIWKEYKEKLSFVIITNADKEEITDYSLIHDYITQLKDAANLFDVRGTDSVLAKLNSYIYNKETQEILDELSLAVNNLDMDKVTILCDDMNSILNKNGDK